MPTSVYNDLEARTTTICLWSGMKPAVDAKLQARFRKCLEQLRKDGLSTVAARINVARVRQEDWAESWKRHFKPLVIRRRLVIKPSWHERKTKPGEAVLVLDPGLSFGTGNHPTTAFCLDQLVRHRRVGRSQSFLDVGTGSGILALSAATLGYQPVEAFDYDPEAVRVASANAEQNGLSRKLSIRQADITRMRGRSKPRYDFICANLISNLLMEQHRRLISWLAPGGVMVLAGILKEEFPTVQRCFEAAGMRLIAAQAKKEWKSGSFVNQN